MKFLYKIWLNDGSRPNPDVREYAVSQRELTRPSNTFVQLLSDFHLRYTQTKPVNKYTRLTITNNWFTERNLMKRHDRNKHLTTSVDPKRKFSIW